MSTLTVFEAITLDGVIQGVGRPDEDTRNGFTRGGWSNGYGDDVLMKYSGEGMAARPGMLFGHRTYADVLGYWSSIGPNPFIDAMLAADKFVVSRSADTELPYPNSTLLTGDAGDTGDAIQSVAALKQSYGRDLMVMGSGVLVRSLLAAGLVDRFALQIYPIVLGTGTRLFGEGGGVKLKLERSIQTTTGVLITEHAVVR